MDIYTYSELNVRTIENRSSNKITFTQRSHISRVRIYIYIYVYITVTPWTINSPSQKLGAGISRCSLGCNTRDCGWSEAVVVYVHSRYTHKYRASDNQRVISLSSWRRDDARHLISSGINDRDQFVHEYESSKVDRYESVWVDPCEFTIRCFESVYQMKENFYFYFIFTTGNGYTRWCNLSTRRYSWFSVP